MRRHIIDKSKQIKLWEDKDDPFRKSKSVVVEAEPKGRRPLSQPVKVVGYEKPSDTEVTEGGRTPRSGSKDPEGC